MQRAFDLIVERLNYLLNHYGEHCDEYGSDENGNCRARSCSDCVLKHAIEIVNEVASEYCEEVCEWERQDLTVGFQSWFTKCRETGLEMQGHIFNEWKFCPYCGKKIKAIEPYKAESKE